MLANGAKLGYKKHGVAESTYKDLPGLKEIPEIGTEAEKVDNTGLTDPHKIYEQGIGDLPDMTYKFKYDNSKADAPYRLMRTAQENGDLLDFQETAADGTKCTFSAMVSVKRTGGGVNGVIEFELTMLVQDGPNWTDPV